MSASLHRLTPRPERLRRDEAAGLRQALLPFLEDPSSSSSVVHAVRQLVGHLDARTASSSRWAFVMISPVQFGAVVRHLRLHSARPALAVDLWTMCFRYLIAETGEVVLRRDEFAAELGIAPKLVSSLMSELVAFGAVSRRRERTEGMRGPGLVRYFVNPNVGTHLSGKARDDAQRAAPILKVIDGSAHPSQRRARAAAVPSPVL